MSSRSRKDLPDRWTETKMVGFAATSVKPASGVPANVDVEGRQSARVSRSLHPSAKSDTLYSGVWVRHDPQVACSFDGTNSMVVPAEAAKKNLSQRLNLRPQFDWTLECWLRPF